MPVILEDWRYRPIDTSKVNMPSVGLLVNRNGDESLRLYGRTIGHPTNRDGKYLYASAVVEFDEVSRTVKTASGSEYRLGKCGGDETEHLKHLQRDVMRNRKSAPVAALKKPAAPAPAPAPAIKSAPRPAPTNTNDTIINLDMGTEVDQAFGRGGHEEDHLHIDAIIAKEMADLERVGSDQLGIEPPVRHIFDAEAVEPVDET